MTYAPGMYPTWVPGMVPTPAPGSGNGTNTNSENLQQASKTRENFPETWVWETIISGYETGKTYLVLHFALSRLSCVIVVRHK